MRNLFLLILLLIELSCVSNKERTVPSTNTIPSGQVATVNPDLPAPFHTEISYEWAHSVVKKANCVVTHQKFIDAVSSIDKFDYSDKNGKQVIADLQKARCGIRAYRTRNPWSKVLATTYSSDREFFYYNMRNNPRALKFMVNTAIHECTHLIGYGHGSNSSVGKGGSVPYGVGKIAEDTVQYCE